jgi:hypothetical protein
MASATAPEEEEDHSTALARPDGLETPAKSVRPFFLFFFIF